MTVQVAALQRSTQLVGGGGGCGPFARQVCFAPPDLWDMGEESPFIRDLTNSPIYFFSDHPTSAHINLITTRLEIDCMLPMLS